MATMMNLLSSRGEEKRGEERRRSGGRGRRKEGRVECLLWREL
jgi:hypothetical protein